MGSDFKTTGSPSSDTMINLGGLGPTSAFGGSQAGSDYGFGTPQSISIDTMMHNGANAGLAAQAHASTYQAATAAMPGNVPTYGNAYNGNIMPSPSLHQHRGSFAAIDPSSPVIGHHHRLSISSNGPYANLERQQSRADSDTTSPGAQQRSGIGENAFAGYSNDTVNSQDGGGDEVSRTRSNDGQSTAPPPWSELKTKAGKERKRLPLACIACRRKKIRCSGEKPACKHCLRSRIPCVYKVTTRKAAPRTDYMAMLDKRLKRMEERVIKIIPKEEQSLINSSSRANVKPPLPPPPPPKATGSKKRAAEQAFGEELDEWANGTKGTNPDSKAAAQKPDAEQTEGMKAHDVDEHNLLQEGKDKLPSKELQEHLSEVFFDYVYGQSYHLLHKPSYMRKLAQGTVPPVLMLAVCAISARFSNHPELRTEPAFLRGESWASAAREIALRRYDTPNITILIVYLILGLHEFGTCQGGRSWMFGGMAQRMAYALQLHKDLDHDPKLRRGSDGKNGEGDLTFTDREIRRRTMWSCFLMDRFNSSGTDRPIFVAEQYIRAQLPIKENLYQMEITGPTEDLDGAVPNPVAPDTGQLSDATQNMGVAAYLIRLVAIWGRLVHYLNLGGKERDEQPMWAEGSKFQAIARATQEWKDSLPPALAYNPDNLHNYASEGIANQFLFLHIVYYQIILFSNRFALPTPSVRPNLPREMPADFIQSSSKAAFEAANQISALVHEAMDHLVVAPFAGYCAFFSSTVHIHGAFSSNESIVTSSKQNLAWNVKFLTKMKKYWGMFHFVTENLRELYRRHADAARSGAAQATKTAEGDGKDAEIFQYGDWFDRYPHGVSGTDYEESMEVKKEPGSDAVLGQKSDLQTVEEFFSKMSPPSRAAHIQQQQQKEKKTPKKRRASKSAASAAKSQEQAQAADAPSASQFQPAQSNPEVQPVGGMAGLPDYFGEDSLEAMQQRQQQSLAFPPGFNPPHNPLLLNQPQQMMSQLDRQMVLNSYAGLDPSNSANAAFGQQHHSNAVLGIDPFQSMSADMPFTSQQHHFLQQQQQQGVWGDPSTAWFMPFNMEPPAVGEDNNLFGGNNGAFDWASFAGFEAPGSGLGLGLTPRADGTDSVREGEAPDGFEGLH